jgi:hypothetical protein
MKIFPSAIPIAMMNEFSSMVPTGSRVDFAVPTKIVR